MENKFDQVLKGKLDSVNASPPAGIWDKIQSNIPASATFDQVVNNKLSNMIANPPASVWSKISGALNPVALPFYKSSFFRNAAATLIILTGALSFYFLQFNQSQPASKTHNLPTEVVQPNNYNKTNGDNNVKVLTSKPENELITSRKKSLTNKNLNNTKQNSSRQNISNPLSISNLDVFSHDDLSNSQASNVNNLPILVMQIVDIKGEDNLIIDKEIKPVNPNKEIAEIIIPQNSALPQIDSNENKDNEKISNELSLADNSNKKAEDPISLPRNPRNLNKYGIAFNYIPAKINSSVNNIAHNDFNVSFAYQNINFTANIGLGIGYSSESAEFSIDYTRYEFVKYQFVTDSLGFTYNSANQTFTPVPYGHQEKVFDDVNYSYTAEAITRNTWVNIPINIGYIKDFKKFSLMAGCGINYSAVVSRNIIGLYEPDDQSTINRFYYPVRTQINSNFAYNITSGAAIKMNENLRLAGELYGVYFQDPLYEGIDERAFGFGLKLGLTYFFL